MAMARRWAGEGPTFEIEWGGLNWILRVDGERPGLTATTDGGGFGSLLTLAGIARIGRWDPEALTGSTLVGFEHRLGRIEATFAPPDWDEVVVRAAWAPHGDDGLDLEIQISAQSVGQLHAIEVLVESGLWGLDPGRSPRFVEPRDARSAALSYDGREPDVSALTTLPPRPLLPLLSRPPSEPSGQIPARIYAEFVHPQDVTRRVDLGMAPSRATRYGLFGHDLEKGVVLRARFRGLWLPASPARHLARERYETFLREPPPLMR